MGTQRKERKVDPTTAGGPAMHSMWCDDCGELHSHKARLPALRRILPASASEVLDAFPCRYDHGSMTGRAALSRDLHALKARRDKMGFWHLPADLFVTAAQE